MSDATTQAKKKVGTVTWAEAARDVLVTSMNRGQLPILGVIGLLTILAWRMPEQRVGDVVAEVVQLFRTAAGFGWFLFGFAVSGWYLHTRYITKNFREECDRMAHEKTQLQNKVAPAPFKSSRKP